MATIEFPVYSTIEVERVDSTAVTQEIDPLPFTDEATVLFPQRADPDGLVGTNTDAFILAIHAVDPPIGGGVGAGSDGPGDPDFFDSVIGLTIRESGQYDSVDVPIYPIDGPAVARSRIPDERTLPPSPGGETDVVAQLWTHSSDGKITPYGIGVEILSTDGEPVRDGATITSLDQSEIDPLEPGDPITAGEEDSVGGYRWGEE